MPRRGIELTEDQWRLVKSHAAKRGQTISEFFADVLGDLGMDGHVQPATMMVNQPPILDAVATTGGRASVRGSSFGAPRPAPKGKTK